MFSALMGVHTEEMEIYAWGALAIGQSAPKLPTSLANKDFIRNYFASFGDSDPELSKSCKMMLALIQYLEDEIEASPIWAQCAPPSELLIWNADEKAIIVEINAYPRAMTSVLAYEIKYAVEPPWSFAVGYSTKTEEAAQMVLTALEKAHPKGFPLSWKRKSRARPT